MAVRALSSALLVALVLAGAGACGKGGGGREQTPDPVEAAYRAGLVPLAQLEAEALGAVAAHMGDAYTDDDALLAALRTTAIPKYREFVLGLQRLHAPPGERAPLHQKLIGLAQAELDALEHLADALARSDGNAVLAVNREQRRLADEIDVLLASWSGSGAGAPGAAPAQAASTPSTPMSDANSGSK